MTIPVEPAKKKTKLELDLEAQQAGERRQKELGTKPPVAESPDRPITPQERINNAELEIKALQAEQNLEAFKKNYADFVTQQKAFESAMSKYPDWQTKEELLLQREIEIKESSAIVDNYNEEKKTDADDYYSNKIQEADELYRNGVAKLDFETKELRVKIDKSNKDLEIRIQLYKEIIEPSRTVLTNSMNLIAQFLRGQGNPKQIYNTLSVYLQNLKNYAEQIKTSVDLK
jgi:hypothetical protein